MRRTFVSLAVQAMCGGALLGLSGCSTTWRYGVELQRQDPALCAVDRKAMPWCVNGVRLLARKTF